MIQMMGYEILLTILSLKIVIWSKQYNKKNSDEEMFVHNVYTITSDSAGSWSFNNDTARTVTMFGVDNKSSSHYDNCKKSFQCQMNVHIFELIKVLVHQKQNFSINSSKVNIKACLIFYYNADNSYLFVNGKEILQFKTDNKNVNFLTQFCLKSISNRFGNIESRSVSANGSVYEISVDYNSTDKSDILNIR